MKKSHFLRYAAVLLLTVAVSFSASLQAQELNSGERGRRSISGIYAFGDSLSDTGNFFNATGLPGPPYYQGRISNGIIWIEHLGMKQQLDPAEVVSYAFAGATTGRENENDDPANGVYFPGMQDELDLFELDLNGAPADPGALYIVWAGANDFFVFGPSVDTIAYGVSNTVTAVQRLYQLGARRIMVVNLPDLGLTPYGRSTADPAGLSFISAAYNSTLEAALAELASSGIRTMRVDASGVLQDIVANPATYDLSNVTDAYLPNFVGDPAQYLFWDSVHPTTDGHAIFAKEAQRVLNRNVLVHR